MNMNSIRFSVIACALLGLNSSTEAGMLTVVASVNANARDDGHDGTFDTLAFPEANSQPGLYAAYFNSPATDFEQRSLLEFDLSGLAPGDAITSAKFHFAYSGNAIRIANPIIPLQMVGYAGDGVIDLGDATIAGNVVASAVDYYPIPFGSKTVAIDPSYVQGLLGNTGFLGLRLEIVPSGTMFSAFGISSREANLDFFFAPRPTLEIEYTRATTQPVPEPGSLALLGTGFGLLILCARRKAKR